MRFWSESMRAIEWDHFRVKLMVQGEGHSISQKLMSNEWFQISRFSKKKNLPAAQKCFHERKAETQQTKIGFRTNKKPLGVKKKNLTCQF
jgi:hypothetical protein